MNQQDILEAARQLNKANLLVVLTGAGVSKESGVPTFRDALDGLWSRYDPRQLATPEAFEANPKLVWDWYAYRRQVVEKVKPNPGHYAIAALEDLLPQVVVVTQNIDGLHLQAGSTDIIELHGNIRRYKCSGNCRGTPTMIAVEDWTNQPTCPHCGRWVRPDIVWFTEALPHEAIVRAQTLSQQASVMLVVGTSGVVYPAAGLPALAKEAGGYVIDVNPMQDEISALADLFLDGPSGEVLPQIVQAMREAK